MVGTHTALAVQGQQDQLPQLLTRLSGFLGGAQQDGQAALSAAGAFNSSEAAANLNILAPLARFTQMQQAQGQDQVQDCSASCRSDM